MRLKGVDRVVTLVGVTESHAFTSTSSSSSSPSWKSLSPWSWSSSSSSSLSPSPSSSSSGGASGRSDWVSRFHRPGKSYVTENQILLRYYLRGGHFHLHFNFTNFFFRKTWTVQKNELSISGKSSMFCDYHHMCHTWFDQFNVEWPLPDEPNFPSHCYPLLVINQTVAILSKYAGVTIGLPQLFTCSHSWNMRVVTKTQQFLMNPWTLHHYWFVAKLISI